LSASRLRVDIFAETTSPQLSDKVVVVSRKDSRGSCSQTVSPASAPLYPRSTVKMDLVRHRTLIWHQESIHPSMRGSNDRRGGAANPATPRGSNAGTGAHLPCARWGISPPASHREVAHPGATAVAPARSPPDLHAVVALALRRSRPES
jgi:hypothetical protein